MCLDYNKQIQPSKPSSLSNLQMSLLSLLSYYVSTLSNKLRFLDWNNFLLV